MEILAILPPYCVRDYHTSSVNIIVCEPSLEAVIKGVGVGAQRFDVTFLGDENGWSRHPSHAMEDHDDLKLFGELDFKEVSQLKKLGI